MARLNLSTPALAGLALLAIATWLAVEHARSRLAPPESVAAAERMRAASAAIREAKRTRGLLQSAEIDRNQTGLLGPEWSEITTTIGVVDAKRTFANPELAASIATLFRSAGLGPGDRIAVVLSGSFVGANVATLAAIEELRLRPVIVSSLAASMFGATDPSMTWLDMEATVRSAGHWRIRSDIAVLGGEAGRARDLAEPAREMLRDAAARRAVPVLDAEPFEALVEALARQLGLDDDAPPKLLVNAGGAQVALGTCRQAESIPPGLVRGPIACTDGTRGLVQRALDRGMAVLNLFKVKDFVRQYGLPYDPVPLPARAASH